MTEKEVTEMLQAKLTCMKLEDLSCVGKGCSRDCNDCEYNYKQGTIGEHEKALELAIKALEEIQQYRAIGTIEECREAVEKQELKKVTRYGDDIPECPYCGCIGIYYYEEDKEYAFCPECGQGLDWSEEE